MSVSAYLTHDAALDPPQVAHLSQLLKHTSMSKKVLSTTSDVCDSDILQRTRRDEANHLEQPTGGERGKRQRLEKLFKKYCGTLGVHAQLLLLLLLLLMLLFV